MLPVRPEVATLLAVRRAAEHPQQGCRLFGAHLAAIAAQQAPAAEQLDLFAWRPTPREPEQLGLF